MLPILNVSKKGRTASAGCKIILCIGFTAIIFLVAQIPDYRYVLKNYGFPDLNAPLCSMEAFAGWHDSVSILEGLVLFETLRLVAAVCVSTVVLLLGIWTKNQLITLSVSTGVLLMPVLLNLLGIHFLDKVSFLLPLTGSHIISSNNPYYDMFTQCSSHLLLTVLFAYATIRYAKKRLEENIKGVLI